MRKLLGIGLKGPYVILSKPDGYGLGLLSFKITTQGEECMQERSYNLFCFTFYVKEEAGERCLELWGSILFWFKGRVFSLLLKLNRLKCSYCADPCNGEIRAFTKPYCSEVCRDLDDVMQN